MERCRWEGQNFPSLKEVLRLEEVVTAHTKRILYTHTIFPATYFGGVHPRKHNIYQYYNKFIHCIFRGSEKFVTYFKAHV